MIIGNLIKPCRNKIPNSKNLVIYSKRKLRSAESYVVKKRRKKI
jgi:hypothetical protein